MYKSIRKQTFEKENISGLIEREYVKSMNPGKHGEENDNRMFPVLTAYL